MAVLKTSPEGKRIQWSSPWLLGFALIAVLYFTGLLDKGFLYLERRYYAPWSIGPEALTGNWEGTAAIGPVPHRLLLTIALRTRSRFNRTTRRNNVVSATYLWVVDGEVQLQATLIVCPSHGDASDAPAERIALSGQANEKASDVTLSRSNANPGNRLAIETLSGTWQGPNFPASIAYAARAAKNGKGALAVIFQKIKERGEPPPC